MTQILKALIEYLFQNGEEIFQNECITLNILLTFYSAELFN